MEIDDDEILHGLAAGGSIDYSSWPALLPRVTARIEKIAHQEFPIPNLPPPPPPPQLLTAATTLPSSIPRGPDSDLPEHFLAPLPSSPTEPRISSPPSDTNKENNPVTPRTPAPLRPALTSTPNATPPQVTSAPLPPGALPPQLDLMLSDITSYLTSTFPKYPPHTIQRISELVINPKQHYRTLITYLHALDRVVRVTSGLNIYPLPSTHAEIPATNLANGVLEVSSRPSSWASPGSDEALGGALLTPIPWIPHNQRSVTSSPTQTAQLPQPQQPQTVASAQEVPAEFEGEVRTESTETIDGPNGVGSIETVSVSVNGIPSMGARGVSVTQGELLRQEQEAGVVPVSQLVPTHHIHSGSASGSNASAVSQQQQRQQEIQARILQQRALAHSQNQARAPSPAEPSDSPSPASNTASTPSSTTLEGDSVDSIAGNVPLAIGSVHSNNAEDEDKPHARGPEEIGADDLGPQTATSSTLPASTTAGSRMQGIDIQAAVGRKPLDTTSLKSDEKTKDAQDDEMDVDEDGREARASTPKRNAEEGLGGSSSKKLKEDSGSTPIDGASRPTGSEPESRDGNDGDLMDKD
ncbi:hypothetical protein GQX73_g3925 [Xylaria multiplex]|uniref:Uncharacterized protein n=1 Tax=Xylaria multiplex TaxID=323545 RepID=A0A7C8MRH8_9PEZI|nr:hypothetical protein GQX73_g3925 [Xylaria multiplex]